MTVMNTCFQKEKAPCGRLVDGERHQEEDHEGLIIDDLFYGCGCRVVRHEYHDGSVHRRVVRHDGKVLSDELIAEHHA